MQWIKRPFEFRKRFSLKMCYNPTDRRSLEIDAYLIFYYFNVVIKQISVKIFSVKVQKFYFGIKVSSSI